MKTTTRTLVLGGALAIASATASPASAMDLKPYVGLDYNFSTFDVKSGFELLSSNNFHGLNPYLGLQVHDNVSVEIGYLQTGKRGITGEDAKLRLQGFHFDLLGHYPLTERFDLIGTTGIARLKGRASGDLGGVTGTISDTETAFRLGIGGRYAITESVGFRVLGRYNFVGFDAIDTGETATNGVFQVNAGLSYRF